MVRRFCAICGKETDELIDNLCFECYRRLHPLVEVPKEVEVRVCRGCFSYYLGGRWIGPKSEDPLEAFREAVNANVRRSIRFKGKVLSLEVSAGPLSALPRKGAKLPVRLKIRGSANARMPSYEEERVVTISVRYLLCPSCMVVAGGKERAVLQLRAEDRELTSREMKRLKEIVEKVLHELYQTDKGAVVLDWEEREGRLDVYLASPHAARRLASYIQRKLAARRLETTKVVGFKRGKPVVRLTVRLLLPPFRVGDIVEFKGNPLLVESIGSRGVKGLLLTTYSRIKVPFTKLSRGAKLLLKREDLGNAMVVAVNPPYVTLLREPGYQQLELRMEKIPLWVKEGAKVGLAELRGRLFVIPLSGLPSF